MKTEFVIFDSAKDLPARWDECSSNPFLKRDFLIFMEKVNPCHQRYHFHEKYQILLITYRLKLDILTFSRALSLRLPIEIAGILLSVASAGYACPSENLPILEKYLSSFALLLVLNTDGELRLAKGKTLPSFYTTVDDFENYLSKMRSHYRYRIRKAMERGKNLVFESIHPSNFDEKLYAFYEEVYERSEGKLEKLSIDFFKKCDANLYRISNEKKELVGFFQTKAFGKELIFLFCGFAHTQNKKYDLYMNILLEILKLGEGFDKIHLGQTTAYSKLRVGAREKALHLHIASRYLPRKILDILAKKLEHRGERSEIHCMKL
ncbi:MAG: hypothetical protein Q4D65_08520 [Peptostreptococcaceae bacterium]|nr:hypothetical protein [Peptostreptococcaceae bacterium]